MADITKSETLAQNRELRSTPGYTNYVISANKDINGIVSSAFLKRYYSNIDAEIYVNGNWAEDISSIQWDISQQTTPLYGYNSYIFDDVAQGARLINGSFTIAFTKPRIIDELIKSYISTKSGASISSYEDTRESLSTIKVKLNKNGKEITSNNAHQPIWSQGSFDIDIVCGEYETASGGAVHIILKDCCITGCRSMRNKDGGVAEELYSFIARDFKTIG